jgi:hypothetical protein
MSDNGTEQHGERIANLESNQKSMQAWMTSIDSKLENLAKDLSVGRRTDWSVIVAGLMLIGAVWAAAINPIVHDLDRSDKNAEKMAVAVLEQNKVAATHERVLSGLVDFRHSTEGEMDRLKTIGSEGADKRLTLLEFRMEKIRGEWEKSDVDKRMAIIEYRLDHAKP